MLRAFVCSLCPTPGTVDHCATRKICQIQRRRLSGRPGGSTQSAKSPTWRTADLLFALRLCEFSDGMRDV